MLTIFYVNAEIVCQNTPNLYIILILSHILTPLPDMNTPTLDDSESPQIVFSDISFSPVVFFNLL